MRVIHFQALMVLSLVVLGALPATRRPLEKKVSAAPPPYEGLRTDDSYEVEELVRDIFVAGVCDNISQIQSIGQQGGIGYFENGGEVIGLDRGIILATGSVNDAQGPNDLTDSSGDFGDNSGDLDLNLLATGQVRDAVGIEFDFVPLDSFVTFRYVFASEEYCEFVGSIYNDVFGFFISGPGIDGGFTSDARNVALIPGTEDFVAINEVNYVSNNQYFIRNELPADASQCGLDPIDWPARDLIQYDGFTKELTARLQLYPCKTYHIRLVVADVGDAFYDSAVFLEAGSFNIGGAVTIAAQAPLATEGCDDGAFRFARTGDSAAEFPLTVNYAVSNSSTATAGEDFTALPGSITIPSGVMEVVLPVQTINDQLPEGPESLTLVLDIPCACYSDSATLVIQDGLPLLVDLPDATFCGNEAAELSPQVSGGTPDYSYEWNTGDHSAVLPVMPSEPQVFAVTVSDACGNTTVDSCWVDIAAPPTAWLQGEEAICQGDTAWLRVECWGQGPWTLRYRIDGALQPPLTGITDSIFFLPATRAGRYEIDGFADSYCQGEGFGEALVHLIELQVTTLVDSASCADLADGGIVVEVSGGTPPYDFSWDQGIGPGSHPAGLAAGTYALRVTDAQGCSTGLIVEVPAPTPLAPVTFDCEDLLTAGPLVFTAEGGTPPYQYSADGQHFADAALFDSFVPGQVYSLVVRDANDCELSQNFLMPAASDGMVDLPPDLELKLGESFRLVPELLIPESLVASIRWIPNEGLSCGDCLTPELTAIGNQTYTLRVIDVFGCTGEASIRVRIDPNVDIYIPNAFSPNGDQVNDRLVIFANDLQVRRVLSFQVYNRWGDQVYAAGPFLANDENEGWDGTFLGRLLDTGIYVYFARVELIDGSQVLREGEVLLTR
jgi:gliding motility-associated-like protein